MMDTLFMGWNYPRMAREGRADELYDKVTKFWQHHRREGNITGFTPVVLSDDGRGLSGFFAVHGEKRRLAEIRQSEAFQQLRAELGFTVDEMGSVPSRTSRVSTRVTGPGRRALAVVG